MPWELDLNLARGVLCHDRQMTLTAKTTATAAIRHRCVNLGLKWDRNQRAISPLNQLFMDSSHRQLTSVISE
jgi:hypothetical protein